jgi:hypothetical protein
MRAPGAGGERLPRERRPGDRSTASPRIRQPRRGAAARDSSAAHVPLCHPPPAPEPSPGARAPPGPLGRRQKPPDRSPLSPAPGGRQRVGSEGGHGERGGAVRATPPRWPVAESSARVPAKRRPGRHHRPPGPEPAAGFGRSESRFSQTG